MIKYLLAPLFLLAALVMLIMPRKHNELGFVKDCDEHGCGVEVNGEKGN